MVPGVISHLNTPGHYPISGYIRTSTSQDCHYLSESQTDNIIQYTLFRMTIDKDVFFKHEVCRGPVVHVDMTLGLLGYTLYNDYIITTLKHTSGDVCRSGVSTRVFMLGLELINDAIDFYKSTGAGFRCDPKILAECKVVLESQYWKFTHDNIITIEPQLQRFETAKNTPISLSMCSRLATTSNNMVWTQLETMPTSLRANLLPDIPTYKFGIQCMSDLKFLGQSLQLGWADDKGVRHMMPVAIKAYVSSNTYVSCRYIDCITRNEAAIINNDVDPALVYAVCYGYCKPPFVFCSSAKHNITDK